jgi:corin
MMNSGSKLRAANDGGSNNNGNSSRPPQTLTQINHAKINQRQDSNISSDSYSMMSSPGYNSKNMEAPLLWSASKMNKSKNHHQNSTDSFIMSSMNKTFQSGKCGAYPKRQDSSISCESQNSSPGSKLLDAPLLAHAAKMSSCKLNLDLPTDCA